MIHVRDATPADAPFIVAAFDSAIPALAAAGDAAQWGTRLFSDRPGFLASTRADVEQSLLFGDTGRGEPIRVFVAQAPAPAPDADKPPVPVGTMTLRDGQFSQHVALCRDLAPRVDQARRLPGGFVYVDVIVADHRAGSLRRGVGAALLERARTYARQRGAAAVYLDCHTGGTGRLVPYYERHGFQALQEFVVPRQDGSPWPAMLMRLDVPVHP